jgi:protease I
VVGGPGAPALAEREDVLFLLRTMRLKGKVVSGICLGPLALAKAGVLAGKKATMFPDRKAILALRDNGGRYVMEPVVSDGMIVTSDGPENAGRFGQALVDALKR